MRRVPPALRCALLAALVLALCAPADAQPLRPGRVRAGVSLGVQLDATLVDQQSALEFNVEAAPVSAQLPNAAIRVFDAGAVVRLAGPIGVGFSASWASGRGDAEVMADIPHPFYFNQPRAVAGLAFGVDHRERAFHTSLVYLAEMGRVEIAISGGASFFQLTQDLVSDVEFVDAFPFDSATFSRATLEEVSASKAGYHAGADLTWRVAPHWGIGGWARYSRASVPLAVGDLHAGTVDVGGLQLAGGLRLAF